ncbi:MFS transporter [Longispora fulva]|uniref:MFS family permease n=1 Tax=Longispora fulva TaxID=619741 RepID=A0A8J7KXI4_9ACTN|nr:MFS transporter [Longispora fulva]MBG6137882.1 MFS family permease [Longispora fulva]
MSVVAPSRPPYLRILRHPVLRRFLPAVLLSAFGDGMSFVAVAWLAVQLAPPGRHGVWTGLAVAAYALPATLGAALLGPLVRRFDGARLVAVDATLRAALLGTIAVLAVADLLGPALYVVLLALSSLLHAWGNAGVYTLVAEELDDEDRVTGNALVSSVQQASFVIGPALAGLVTAFAGPGWVIGADAVTFAFLAVTCVGIVRSRPPRMLPPAEKGGAWLTLRSHPQLLALIAVTCAFFFLYGPVEVAMPVHIADELHASAGLLGGYVAAYGVGTVFGSLLAGLLRRLPLWPVIAAIVVGWGLCLLPSGLTDAVAPGMVGFGIGGFVYGPFTAICTALFQRSAPAEHLSQVLAFRGALITPAAALGTAVGGPLVGAIGGRQTLLVSAWTTILLGALLALGSIPSWRRR